MIVKKMFIIYLYILVDFLELMYIIISERTSPDNARVY